MSLAAQVLINAINTPLREREGQRERESEREREREREKALTRVLSE